MPNEEKSLAPEPSLTDSAQRGIATTVDTGESEQSTQFTVQQSVAAGPLLDGRYQLGTEIARGGMGLVHRAVDVVFQREVAVKLLLPKWEKETDLQRQEQRRAQMLEAFRYEAEITARLQHPGVPPVHELGRLSDGLPFLAMKLIQGQTLQQLLQERTSLLADLSRWLQIFEQIAQAVGYAHSQRMLHRDLKPANIMVGEFGEVQVMDWGLAKIVGEAEKLGVDFDDDDSPAVRQFVSRRGDIKGTLAYMPPEQARGEIDELDPRADVFALGAILCEILTGSPPYKGRTILELKHQAAAGELAAVHQSIRLCGADAETVELGIACLSADPSDRPFDGTAVAQAVAAHRANVEQRLRRAETERALSQQQLIEQSRRRKLWYGIAAALLLVVLASSTLAIVYARSNSIIADREIKATNAANLAKQREGEARAASERALAQEKLATEKAAISDAVNKFLQNDLLVLAGAQEQLEAGLEVNPDLKVRDLVLRAATRIEGKFANQPVVEAETRMMLGISLYRLGEFAAAAKQHERVRELSLKLFGPDDPKTLDVTHALAEAHIQAGQLAEGVALLTELVEQYKDKHGADHPDTLEQINTLANALRAAGEFPRAVKLYEETLALQTKTLGAEHLGTLKTRHNLAMAYRNAGDLERAVPMLEETAEIIARVHGPDHPDTLGVTSNLALLYRSTGQLKRAFPLYERALEGRRKSLGADHPDTIASMSNLAVALYSADQLDRALPLMQEVLKLRRAKLGPEHLQTLEAMNNLASVLQEMGDLKEALALSEPVLKLRMQKLGPDHPQTLGALQNVGNIYNDLRDFKKAIPLLEQAFEVRRAKFGEQHADTLRTKQNLSACYCEAKEFAKALPLLEDLLQFHQEKGGDKHPNTLVTMNNLSLAYHEGGQFARAAKLRTDLWKLSGEMFGPKNIRTVGSLLNLAMTETQLKQYVDAEEHLQKVWNDSQAFPAQIKPGILVATAEAFVKLYEAWDKAEELAKWQEELKNYSRSAD
jgi:serine/threonine protein kinase